MHTLMTRPTKPTATDHMDLNLNEEAFVVEKKGSYVIISK